MDSRRERQRQSRQSSGFRLDIQGLRAIAVGGVVLYHLWPERIPGGFVGVDVFFVISGFLITSHLLRKPPRRASDVARFWARRVSRLLPAALLVITVTCIAVVLIAPMTVWEDTGSQAIAATGYVQNWFLANESVDYLAADNKPTALQHFWSLSVEEQFYFVWPLVIGGIALLVRRLHMDERRGPRLPLIVLTVGLFAFAAWYSFAQPAAAYFISPARFWELALGGVVAVTCGHLAPGVRMVRTATAWLGIAGILASFWLISSQDVFPGWIALLPTVSTALVIGANSVATGSPLVLLRYRPVQFIGSTSYSIYLWHWPLIVLVPFVSDDLGILDRLVILVMALLLAYGTQVLVEKRFRKSRAFATTTRTFVVGLICMLVAASCGMGLRIGHDRTVQLQKEQLNEAVKSNDPCLGGRAIGASGSLKEKCSNDSSLLLGPESAADDKSDAYPDGCWSNSPFNKRPVCHYGSGKTKIALVGNSHAGHWLPALQKLAKENDWTIDTYLVSRCAPSGTDQDFDTQEKTDGCREWSNWAADKTADKDYDAIIASDRQSLPVKSVADSNDASQDGYSTVLKKWRKANIPVVVLRDIPTPKAGEVEPVECVAEHGSDAKACSGSTKEWRVADPLADAAKARDDDDVSVINPQSRFCPDNTCRSAIGGVVAYFDETHMTATYSATLSNWLGKRIEKKQPDLISS